MFELYFHFHNMIIDLHIENLSIDKTISND